MRWKNRPRRIGLSWKLRNVCLQGPGLLEHSLRPRQTQDTGVWDANFSFLISFIAGGELDSGGSSAERVHDLSTYMTTRTTMIALKGGDDFERHINSIKLSLFLSHHVNL